MALREILAVFGIKFDDAQLRRGQRAVDKTKGELRGLDSVADRVTDAIKGLGAALATAFAASTISQQTAAVAEHANQIGRWSQQLRVSQEDMLAWAGVASRVGAEIDDVGDSLSELRLKAQLAIEEAATEREQFQRLGITVEQLRANIGDTTGLMDFFIDRLSAQSDAAVRASVADELLSDAGRRILPVLEQGADAVRRQREAIISNNTATIKTVQAMRELNPALAEASETWRELWATVILRVLPLFRMVLRAGSRLSEMFTELAESTTAWRAAFVALGSAAGAAAAITISTWGPAVLPLLAAGAAVGGLALFMDDLFVTAQGGDSIIRRLLERFAGVGQARAIIRNMNIAMQDLRESIAAVVAYIAPFEGFAQTLGDIMGRAWGEDVRRTFQEARTSRNRFVDDLFTTAGERRLQRRGQVQRIRSAEARSAFERDFSDVLRGEEVMGIDDFQPVSEFSIPEADVAAELREREAVRAQRAAAADPFGQTVMPGAGDFRGDVTQNNEMTFNIQGDDPQAIGQAVRRVLVEEQSRNLRQLRDGVERE